MKFSIRINLMKTAMLILIVVFVSAAAYCQSPAPLPAVMTQTWWTAHWPTIALVVSESLAFLPTKFAGIAKSIFSFVCDILKKKDQ